MSIDIYFPSGWNIVLSLLKTWHETVVYIFMSDRWKFISGKYRRCVISLGILIITPCIWQIVVLEKIKHLLGLLLCTEIYWVDHSHRRLGSASPSMILIYPICFRRQSVTNLISNNICKTCINISFYFCRVRMKTEIEEFLLNSAETTWEQRKNRFFLAY